MRMVLPRVHDHAAKHVKLQVGAHRDLATPVRGREAHHRKVVFEYRRNYFRDFFVRFPSVFCESFFFAVFFAATDLLALVAVKCRPT